MDKTAIRQKIKELQDLIEEKDYGMYTDPDTGLMWSDTSPSEMPWDKAFKYAENCRDGNFNDWRLPTRPELITLIDDTTSEPACKDPEMLSSYYWSSTTYAYNTPYAWYVYFGSGFVNYYYKASNYYVRCVRSGQPT